MPSRVAPPKSSRVGSTSTISVLLNTAATGALGAAFWIVAAQLFPERAVAAAVGASSLLIVVSFVAQLNLATALSRFLPNAGPSQRDIVSYVYRVSVGFSVVLAAAVLVVGLVRGGAVVSGGDWSLTIATAVSIPIWTVFALQDGALVALRKAHWLPIENGLTAAAKLLLLAAFIPLAGQAPILIAWTLPALPAVYIVNRAMFSKLLGSGRPHTEPRSLVRYAAVDFVGAGATLVSLRAVPLLLVETADVQQAAYVGVPLSILTVAAIALTAISRLVLAEMSHEPGIADDVASRSQRFIMTIFVPGSLLGAALSYPVLLLAGREYAEGGALVLAFGFLGLIPAAYFECQLARVRFANRMATASRLQIERAVLLVVSSLFVLAFDRVDWLGAAFAVTNVLAAVRIRRLHAGQLAPTPGA